MDAVKHTPGPWHSLDDGHDTARKIHGGQHHYPLATVSSYWEGPGPGRVERNANANLIAAAPDMLAVLRSARFALEATDACLRLWNEDRGSPANVPGILSQIDAAIAKAEGL